MKTIQSDIQVDATAGIEVLSDLAEVIANFGAAETSDNPFVQHMISVTMLLPKGEITEVFRSDAEVKEIVDRFTPALKMFPPSFHSD